jgi:hypothetical protein
MSFVGVVNLDCQMTGCDDPLISIEWDSVNFDPLVLSKGFESSAAPMLAARSAIYALGLSKRLSQK